MSQDNKSPETDRRGFLGGVLASLAVPFLPRPPVADPMPMITGSPGRLLPVLHGVEPASLSTATTRGGGRLTMDVTNGGSGYTSPPTVTIQGGGGGSVIAGRITSSPLGTADTAASHAFDTIEW